MFSLRYISLTTAALLPLLLLVAEAKICPDGVSKCIDRNTCCAMQNNAGYACCPYPNAICCSDHVHCCPSGYQCDVKYDRCNAASPVSPLLMVLAEMSAQSPMLEITPGKTVETAALPMGIAKPEVTGMKKSSALTPHIHVLSALESSLRNNTKLVAIPCPDGSICSDLSTCCSMGGNVFGCCSFENGVCCSNNMTCCPQDTTCSADHWCQPNNWHQ